MRKMVIPKILLIGLALITGCCAARAQYNPPPERLAHVEGIVVNSYGDPVAGASVTLARDGAVLYRTTTDAAGGFAFAHVHGQFTFRVGRTQYAPAVREIYAGDELVAIAKRKKLYVIAGPGACEDECSAVLTSRSEFEKTLKKNLAHLDKESPDKK